MDKKLVAYFSVTDKTKKVSQSLASAIDADLFEIMPEQPYTSEDIDWNDPSSRCAQEKSDPAYRPMLRNSLENSSQYSLVFLGFPIWWYREPAIIDTFIESHDFSHAEVILFCTSGGSGLGNIAVNFSRSIPGTVFRSGRRFLPDVDEESLKEWAEEYISDEKVHHL